MSRIVAIRDVNRIPILKGAEEYTMDIHGFHTEYATYLSNQAHITHHKLKPMDPPYVILRALEEYSKQANLAWAMCHDTSESDQYKRYRQRAKGLVLIKDYYKAAKDAYECAKTISINFENHPMELDYDDEKYDD